MNAQSYNITLVKDMLQLLHHFTSAQEVKDDEPGIFVMLLPSACAALSTCIKGYMQGAFNHANVDAAACNIVNSYL